MSKLFVDEIVHQSSQGSGTITLGASGETINIPSGSTINLSNSTVTLNDTMKSTPNFLAYRSSNQNMTQNATTTVVMNAESFDTDSAYSTSVGTFTCPTGKAGKYVFSLGYSLNSNGASANNGIQNETLFIDDTNPNLYYIIVEGRNGQEDSFRLSVDCYF